MCGRSIYSSLACAPSNLCFPARLCFSPSVRRWAKLQELWASHGISSEVTLQRDISERGIVHLSYY